MQPETFIAEYEKALASQHWESVEPLIHTNACVTFSTGLVHRGLRAVKSAFEKNFSVIKNEHYSMTEVEWVIRDNAFAVYTFKYHWSGIINGQTSSGSGKGTATLVWEYGKWKLLAEHLCSAKT